MALLPVRPAVYGGLSQALFPLCRIRLVRRSATDQPNADEELHHRRPTRRKRRALK
jgi:hypothetical protein